jgi:AraC-like DNA-binding protein
MAPRTPLTIDKTVRLDVTMSLALEVAPLSPSLTTRYPRLFEAVASRASGEGCSASIHPGVRFFRVSKPATFRKTLAHGVTLHLCVQGRKEARFGDHALRYDPKQYMVLTGESSFDGCIVDATADRPYLGVMIDIPAEAVAKTLAALADNAAAPAPETVPAFVSAVDDSVAAAVERLLRAIDDPLEREIVAPLALEELVFRLLRSDAAAAVRCAVKPDGGAATIERAMAYMRANSTKPLTVEGVARHVAMSPSHFAHRFRALARTSPMRYLKQLRLNEARALMLSGKAGVGEAALRVGYESASHFTRDFKSSFGAAPARYVRALRGSDARDIAGSG